MDPFDFSTGTTNPETFPTEEADRVIECSEMSPDGSPATSSPTRQTTSRGAVPGRSRGARCPRSHGVELNTYPGRLGHEGLRRLMAQREFDREGVRLDPERIALTNGSMQAVTLVAEALCEGDDDVVLMEEYCYSGTIRAYRPGGTLGIEMIGIPVDGRGMRTDALARTLERLRSEGDCRARVSSTCSPATRTPPASSCRASAASSCCASPGSTAASSWRTTATATSTSRVRRSPRFDREGVRLDPGASP